VATGPSGVRKALPLQEASDHPVVLLKGEEVRIPADPPEVLPVLAESGNFGVTLVGESS
jgi:hypothetical protein